MAEQSWKQCIEACDDCAQACAQCALACLSEAEPRKLARCIALDLDCEAQCRLASSALARGSEFLTQLMAMCARLCEACAQECERHEHLHCQECAAACRHCARLCHESVARLQAPR